MLFRSEKTDFAMKLEDIHNIMIKIYSHFVGESDRLSFILDSIFWLRVLGQLLSFSRPISITTIPLAYKLFHGR